MTTEIKYPRRDIKPNKDYRKNPLNNLTGWQAIAALYNMDFDDVKIYVEQFAEWPSPKFEYELWKFLIWSDAKDKFLNKSKMMYLMTLGNCVNLFYPNGIEFKLFDKKTKKYNYYRMPD